MTRHSKPRLLVLNQYYWPGVEATARLLHDLCRSLVDEYDITVITGKLARGVAPSGEFVPAGIRIVRVRSTAFDRRRLLLRATNYVTYLLGSACAALFTARPDIVLSMTDPPIIGNVALLVARRFRAPLVVVSQDVFPEVAVELERLENPVLIALLRRMINFYLRRANRVVAIGTTMRDRLIAKGARPDRIQVIPNWVDTKSIVPSSRQNEWAGEHSLVGRFVVMHSGNVGHAQNLDSLIRSATFLRDLDRLQIMIIGAGARYADLFGLAKTLEVESVEFEPYQPRKVLSQSLSAADLHVVGLARGLSGYVVPSRLYGIMAVGRPVIVAAERSSETAQLVEEVGCGIVIEPGRPDLLACAIRAAYDGEFELDEMGRRARTYVVEHADTTVALSHYRSLLRDLVGAH